MPALAATEEVASLLGASDSAVSVRNVGKIFNLPHQQYSTLKERVLHPFSSSRHDELRALEDVSFEVADGEFFGIVGRNGSGKSTLLKCLAGIYATNTGRIGVRGRLSPFIELGVGFNPDLTARDNVVINAIMLGLSRKEATERFDEIIAFAELEEFIDLKLKNYSSGMNVRLAFAVAIQVDADVLLVDEVLAVGDAAFQQKCFEQFQRMKDEGRTILFVTHDMSSVERFCDRAMLLDRGHVVDIAGPREIARAYNEMNFGRLAHEETAAEERAGDHLVAEVADAWFEDPTGRPITAMEQGEVCRLCYAARFHAAIDDPIFAVTLRNEAGMTMFATSTEWRHGPTGRFDAGDTVTVRVELRNHLAASRYAITPSIARAGTGADALDLRVDLAFLMVHATQHTGSVVDLPHELTLERG